MQSEQERSKIYKSPADSDLINRTVKTESTKEMASLIKIN